MTKSCLWEALTLHGIPHPPREVSSDRFTRWGKNDCYWCIAVGDGYMFGDWRNGLAEMVFQRPVEKLSQKEAAQRQLEIEKAVRESQLLVVQRQAEAAERAKKIWNESTPVGR